MPAFPAITHVALTVTSLERSVPWYRALFGSDPILDEDTGAFRRVAWLTGGTIVGLTQFHDVGSTGPFDESSRRSAASTTRRWNAASLGAPNGRPSSNGTHKARGGRVRSVCGRTRLIATVGMPSTSR